MVVLKKMRGSTLMETLVASVLILVVFIVASMIFNNLFLSSIKNNTKAIDAHIKELMYLHHHNKLTLPFDEEYKGWQINIETFKQGNVLKTEFDAFNPALNNSFSKHIIENE
jgi:predicted PurR-regulated permease PerM